MLYTDKKNKRSVYMVMILKFIIKFLKRVTKSLIVFVLMRYNLIRRLLYLR